MFDRLGVVPVVPIFYFLNHFPHLRAKLLHSWNKMTNPTEDQLHTGLKINKNLVCTVCSELSLSRPQV